MTDNHGAWTLGCYGNKDIRTPNLDRLARQGMLFTSCYSSNGVCSPTRATFLTGLIPSQHGIHCFLRGNEYQVGKGARCLIEEFTSLPEILAQMGYVCGLVGKWHLGGNESPQEGFTSWVTMPHGGTSTFYDARIIEDGKIRTEPTYLTDFWTTRGVDFIEKNKQRPFFLFLAYNGPYGLSKLLLRDSKNRHAEYYADKELPSFPREKVQPWLFNNREYINNPTSMRRYACEVSGVDDGVGRILAALKERGLEDNTLVIFTADQGLAGGHSGYWGMGDHTRPITAYDWTMHIPLIYRHPGQIPAGKRADILTSNYDFMPTVLDYLGAKDKMPKKPASPGRSYAATLRSKNQTWDNVVYYEFESVRSVRTPQWRYVHRLPRGPHELFDLNKDPGERSNLIDQPQHRQIQARLENHLQAFFNKYADPRYDLYKQGKSKVKLLVPW